MTRKQKKQLEQIEVSAQELRGLCWDYRREKKLKAWFPLTKSGVQDLQLKRFLDEEKGITTETMTKIAKYLKENW